MSATRPPASGHGGGDGEVADVKTDLAAQLPGVLLNYGAPLPAAGGKG